MASSFFSTLILLYITGFIWTTVDGVEFSKLNRNLIVTTSPIQGKELKAGEDKFAVTWEWNQTIQMSDNPKFKKVKVMLCYAPISQKDRGWRKTVDDLKKDKTCQFEIITKPFSGKSNTSYEYKVNKDVPSATYFVRTYILDSNDNEVGYGQTTNAEKKTNLFVINGITGRHASLDIAAGCFSAFSIGSLLFFFFLALRTSYELIFWIRMTMRSAMGRLQMQTRKLTCF